MYDAEDNDSTSCVFHADKDGKVGHKTSINIFSKLKPIFRQEIRIYGKQEK